MKFFILQVVGRPMGSHQHATLKSANAEAFRLMQKEKRDVNVYASYDDVLTPTTLLQLVATHTMTIDLDHSIINKDHPEASVVDNKFNDDLERLGEELGLQSGRSAAEEAINATYDNQIRILDAIGAKNTNEAIEKINQLMKNTDSDLVHHYEIYSVEKTQVGGTHYSDLAIQPAEFSEKNKLSFLEGCVVKRMCRHRRKNGIEDLRKSMHEIQLIAKYEYGIDNLMP